jgi:DNA-binding CsgD family transcriptional regulator
MRLPLDRRDGYIFGVWQVRRLFEWLKRKPNPELIRIDEKLDRANDSLNRLASNITDQTATLDKVDGKIDSTFQGIQQIDLHLAESTHSLPDQMRTVVLEALKVWVELEETRKRLSDVARLKPDTPGNSSGSSPASGRAHPDVRYTHPDDLKGLRAELERLTLRQRQLISILMERGWLSYEEIANHLGISISRARNYVSEIIGRGFPVSKIDSVEGKKIGISTTIQDFILEGRHPDTHPDTSGKKA